MSYESDALFGPGETAGTLDSSTLNAGAVNPGDLFITGIANAAMNALNIASGAQPTAQQQIQLAQHSEFQTLVFLGVMAWLFMGKKA